MADLQFLIADAITGVDRGELKPSAYAFNEPIWGAGQLEMTIPLPKAASKISSLRMLTEPDKTAVYVLLNNRVLFCGPINFRNYTPGQPAVRLRAQSWKAWFYTRIYPTRLYKTAYDQYKIAQDLIDFAANDIAAPSFLRTADLSGKTRDFTVEPGWSIGKALDEFGSRDGGFEWSVSARRSAVQGQFDRYVDLYEEGAVRSNAVLLNLDTTLTQNKIAVGDIEEDGSPLRTKIWGVGEGTWPDVKIVSDSDPSLASGLVLLREEWMSWSGVVSSQTLFDHARAERIVRSYPFTQIDVSHPISKPNILNYLPGDRARLRIVDPWYSVDQAGIRIVDRAVSKSESEPAVATVTLDMLDVREDLA